MKIVMTGGPSAGKTSAIDILFRSDWLQMVVVQEAASVLFRGGFPRRPEPEFMRSQQRAIYHVQKELEEFGHLDSLHRNIVCDRGSLDGLAYWPDDEDSFFKAVGSNMDAEISRYDWVIHLDSVHTFGNEQSLLMNTKVKHAWRKHPRRLIVPHTAQFLQKIDSTLKAVQMILHGRSVELIRDELNLSFDE